MVYEKVRFAQIANQELVDLMRRAQKLTQGSYELYEKNYKALSALFKKIINISRQEKEWYIYFNTLYNLMYADMRTQNYRQIVKYAEAYYRDSEIYMDSAIPNYPGTDMALLNVWICTRIFQAYVGYYQIDDAKMEDFMRRYEETAQKYGHLYEYYQDEMYLSCLYRDSDRAQAAARNFLKHEKEITNCYVCAHTDYLEQLILNGQYRQAETLMLDLINKNIPPKHVWCYKYCEVAEPASMYSTVLQACVWNGKKDMFDYFYGKYWSTLPEESQRHEDSNSFDRLLCAAGGNFEGYEDDLRVAAEDAKDEENRDTTENNMQAFLKWWRYFILLDRSGVHTLPLTLPGLETDEDGQVRTLAVSDYMEARADYFGEQFAQVRAAFDYKFAKDAYKKCFL